MARNLKVIVVMGTRPEAIKLAPVVRALSAHGGFAVKVLATAQHRSMLDQVLEVFEIEPDFDLGIMRPGQSLTDVTVRAVAGVGKVLEREKPDWVIVQGDTTTAFVSALAAYYRQIRVAHVEAGLRTEDRYSPFPEEMNRRLVSALADVHFAPTPAARANLRREGIATGAIHVTGNTVIDALKYMVASGRLESPAVLERIPAQARVLLVTAHRRESFGAGLRSVFLALKDIVRRHADVEVVYPVHPNPNVRHAASQVLGRVARVHLVAPLDYRQFVALMSRAYLILTDSGGIQEEAPGLGKPVLVLRDKTERPEAIAAGTALLVGTDRARIVRAAETLLNSKSAYARMAHAANPFGDGRAGERIARILARMAPPARLT